MPVLVQELMGTGMSIVSQAFSSNMSAYTHKCPFDSTDSNYSKNDTKYGSPKRVVPVIAVSGQGASY